MIAEQGITIDVVKVTVFFRWTSRFNRGNIGHVQAKKTVEPALYGVTRSVTE